MKYQNKGDNNWQLTSNKYACWHNTFFSFLFLLFLSCTTCGSTGPGVAVQVSVCVAWSAGQNRTDRICVCPLGVSVLFFVLLHLSFALKTSVCISVSHASPIPQHANCRGGPLPTFQLKRHCQ